MTDLETIADADADIAALVYAGADRPDLVLCAFAATLRMPAAGRADWCSCAIARETMPPARS
jgi:hypothetical protein